MSDYLNFQSIEQAQWAFWEAYTTNNYEKIESMLEDGREFYPDINKSQYVATPPILNALSEDNLQMLSVLFVAGADLNASTEYGWTFGHELMKKSPVLIRKLVNHANLKATTPDGQTPLMYAINEKNWEVVDLLFESGVNLNIYATDNKNNNSAAHLLAKAGQYGLLEKLIDSDESSFMVFQENYNKETPFDFIGNAEIKKILMEKVVSLEAKSKGLSVDEIKYEKSKAVNVSAVSFEENESNLEEKPVIPTMAPKKMGMGGIKKNF